MKICSLLPSGTEILYALGLGDQVIGVTDLCDYPPEVSEKRVVCRSKIDVSVMSSAQVEQAMRRLQETGESPFALDETWLLEHSPDVVLTQDLCYYCEIDAGVVQESVQPMSAPPQILTLRPRTLDEIFQSILQVCEVCRASSRARLLVDQLRERLWWIQNRLASVRQRPRVFSLEGANPLVVGGHWIPELLALAGGKLDGYSPGCPAARILWSQVREYRPEKLYIDLCSSDLARNLREVPWLATQEDWADLPAVQSGEVYLIDHVYFSRPGPRIVQGLEILAQLTHPEVFSGMIPPNTVLKLSPGLAVGCPPQEIGRCFRPYPDNAKS